LDVTYKNKVFKNRFKTDLIVENKIIVENKAIKNISKADEAQLLNYLKTTGIKLGLLFNYGSTKFEMLRRVF
jgi:GxxExxY protein